MRIIAGTHRSRIFKAPRGHKTHPMSERARGAIFNALGDIAGLTVLDAFAGSGALSFEAVSRGAASAYAVEIDNTAYKTLTENIEALGMTNEIHAVRANVSSWSSNNPDQQYDIVFVDPPYTDWRRNLVEKLTTHLKTTGLMVVSYPGDEETPELKGLVCQGDYSYGDARIAYYKFM